LEELKLELEELELVELKSGELGLEELEIKELNLEEDKIGAPCRGPRGGPGCGCP